MPLTRMLQADLDFYAFLMLLIVFISTYSKSERKFLNYKLFISLIISTMLLLFLEGSTWVINRNIGTGWRILNICSNTVFFILNPVPPLLWVCYADYQLYENAGRVKKILKIFGLLTLIHAVLSIFSHQFKILFYIDNNNIYHRAPLIIVTSFICYMFLIYALIIIIKNKNNIDRKKFYALVLFSLPPLVGGILQLFFYGVAALWPGVALSLLLIYINIQNYEMHTDYLTGVFNRKQFEKHLESKIEESLNKDKMFALLILDLDRFKEINDTYGHLEGDIALETAARILKESLRQNDFIARYAGDEFAVILDTGNKGILEEIVRRVKDNFKYYNMNSYAKYEISFSIGYDIYDNEKQMNLEDYFMYIDKLMYDEKKSKKEKR